MASSCSPLHAASHPVTTNDVTVIVSDVLRRLLASGHLRPLVTALIDGVGDEFGSRGTGLVLAALLESRGSEESLKSNTGQFFCSSLLTIFLLTDSLASHFPTTWLSRLGLG